VTVNIGTPRLPKGETDWECPFRISGGGIRVNECGYGVDPVQAPVFFLRTLSHAILARVIRAHA
jgi:hypothetical protein